MSIFKNTFGGIEAHGIISSLDRQVGATLTSHNYTDFLARPYPYFPLAPDSSDLCYFLSFNTLNIYVILEEWKI